MFSFSTSLLILASFMCGILAIPPSEDLLCGENEQYLECSTCEPSCEPPPPHTHLAEHPPSESCNKPRKQCGVNERYFDEHQCGTACEPSCENPHPGYCEKLCVQNVCQCEHGFVRHPLSNKCVQKSECPVKYPICAENEVYENGNACEPTCDDPEGKRVCTLNLVEKCRCLPGFVRHDRKCVPLSHCPRPEPPSCGENEKYAECGKQCEPSCDHPKPSGCIFLCAKGCLCLPGFVRHPSGKCVPESYCPMPKPVCSKNEVWIDNGSGCEPSCINPRIIPISECNTRMGGCTCKPGAVRNFDRKCVLKSECGDSVIRSGDQTFQDCCIDNRLPKEYLPKCNYTATIEITKLMIEYLSPNKSPRDRSSAVDVAGTVLKCFTGGKNVSDCCRGKGVKESCLPICSASLYDLSKGVSQTDPFKLMDCLNLGNARPKDVARRILKLAQTGTECFAEANAEYLNLH
ncbi:trypsin inhibitor like cysteine rich domain-containing protein [Ditylenchus destructor]|uniref:Trypsin inhibitor like cysteine rich domain-containing protein n=1 Tax=Ditylenchus destructor TaxID=166010 RepID=A0AAD4MQ39_9BILA|nr:trypsin inhibitor like cysteine rich domain-containing protein [Ditylenchus destructor]